MMIFLIYVFAQSGPAGIYALQSENRLEPDMFYMRENRLMKMAFKNPCVSVSGTFATFKASKTELGLVSFKTKEYNPALGFPTITKAPSEENFLFNWQQELDVPFLFTETRLFAFNEAQSQWLQLPVKPTLSISGPNSPLVGRYQMNVQFPFLVSLENNGVLVYSAQSGMIQIYDSKGTKTGEKKIKEKARPVKDGTRILWLNVPEEGDCQESSCSSPLALQSSVKIPELNRYALIQKMSNGFWVVTFPIGFKQSLKSWDTGTAELYFNFVQNTGASFTVNTYPFENAPLNFDLGVSSSGSPKLEVTPSFKLLPVLGEKGIGLITHQNCSLISEKGSQKDCKIENSESWIGLTRKEGRIGAWTEKGLFLPF